MASQNIQPLIDQVKANDSIVDSAVTWINGSHQRLDAAVADALAAGATADELKPLTDELALQKTKVQAVADAIAAQAPPSPPPPPPAAAPPGRQQRQQHP